MKKEKKEYTKLLYVTLGISLFLFVSLSSLYIYESTKPIDKTEEKYYGSLGNMNWMSSGYGTGLRSMVNNLITKMMEYKISNIDGNINIIMEDDISKEFIGNFQLNHDKATGETSFSFNFLFPGGIKKDIFYKLMINDDYNLSKFLNTDELNNWTLKDLLLKILKDNNNVTFVGEKSNVSLFRSNDYSEVAPNFEIQYVRNSPPEEYLNFEESEINDTFNNKPLNYTYDDQYGSDDKGKINRTYVPKYKESESIIINATPRSSSVTIIEGNDKIFTVYNDYDELRWYLDNKIQDENIESFKLKGLEPGEYTLKVVVEKSTVSQSKTWFITVEKDVAQGGKINWILLIILFLILIIFIIVTIIYIKKYLKEQENASSQLN